MPPTGLKFSVRLWQLVTEFPPRPMFMQWIDTPGACPPGCRPTDGKAVQRACGWLQRPTSLPGQLRDGGGATNAIDGDGHGEEPGLAGLGRRPSRMR